MLHLKYFKNSVKFMCLFNIVVKFKVYHTKIMPIINPL